MDKFDSWHKCSISELECALNGRTKNKKETALGTMRVTRRFSACEGPFYDLFSPINHVHTTFTNLVCTWKTYCPWVLLKAYLRLLKRVYGELTCPYRSCFKTPYMTFNGCTGCSHHLTLFVLPILSCECIFWVGCTIPCVHLLVQQDVLKECWAV